jgi:hypothetical protein
VRGGENKLISLTQPAVTPPQHDINPKPRLSLFKLYESLRRRIGGTSSWEALSERPLPLHPLYPLPVSPLRSRIPSLVGYKQEYSKAEGGREGSFSRSLRYFYRSLSQRFQAIAERVLVAR